MLTYFGFTLPSNPDNEIRLTIRDPENPPPLESIPQNRRRARALVKMSHRAKLYREQLLSDLSLPKVQHLCSRGIHVSLLNVARILSLRPEDFTDEGLERLRLLNSLTQMASKAYGIEHTTRYHESLSMDLKNEPEANRESVEVDADASQYVNLRDAHLGGGKQLMEADDMLAPSLIHDFGDATTRHVIVPLKVELKAYRMIKSALLELLSKYPTDSEEDKRTLNELENRAGQHSRLYEIVQCRLGEEQILVQNIEQLQKALKRQAFEEHVSSD